MSDQALVARAAAQLKRDVYGLKWKSWRAGSDAGNALLNVIYTGEVSVLSLRNLDNLVENSDHGCLVVIIDTIRHS